MAIPATTTASMPPSVVTPAMTTAFTPAATTCLNNQLTMLENQAFEIWLNYPLPVPLTTISDCYPSQFMSSFVASIAHTTEAAFSPLVCPGGYTAVPTSWPAASNYIACCPSSYGLATNDTAPSTRPAYNAKCYTNLSSGATIQITVYDSSSISNTNSFTVSASTMQAYAIPYEGYADKNILSMSVPASTTSSTSSTSPASSTIVPAATYTIMVADAFYPNTINASTGDTLVFGFESGNHSLVQSSFNTPCEPLANGTDSGFLPNLNNQVPFPAYVLQVNTTEPQWFYSEGDGDCASGITFGLNPNSSQTEAEFQKAAMAEVATAQNKSGTSTAVKVGVSIGVVFFALLVAAALAAFLVYRRRKIHAASKKNDQAIDNWTFDQKASNSPQLKPRVPDKNYELSATRSQEIHLPVMRYELPSTPIKPSSSGSSGRIFNTASPLHQGSFYREADEPSLSE